MLLHDLDREYFNWFAGSLWDVAKQVFWGYVYMGGLFCLLHLILN